MKKLLLFLFLFSTIANAQIINFPDANFKAKLLSASPDNSVAYNQWFGNYGGNPVKIDTNNDGEIDQNEAALITCLKMESSNITNLQGIEYFTNLRWIILDNNQITSMNFTGLNNLEYFWCDYNQLTSLDFTGLINLKDIQCAYNNLTSLNLSGLINLESLECANNQLTSLDFHTNTWFYSLGCANNNLNYINLKNGSEQSSAWDPSSCNCDSWGNNPNLAFICADEDEIDDIEYILSHSYSELTKPQVNSYCTFVPGGNNNTITGSILFDVDNNGCDASDAHPLIKVNISDGTNSGSGFTNTNGNYTFYTQAGNHTLTPDIEVPAYFNINPISAVVDFPVVDSSVATQNFCITANGVHSDVEVVIVPIWYARPGFQSIYKLVYKNKGNQTISGNVNFAYDDAVLDFVSTWITPGTPDIQSTGSLTWNYSNLLPFESRSIYIVLKVNSPTETPPVNIDDVLHFEATINPIAGDETPSDNTITFDQTVVGSYDPNDIQCIEGAVVSPSKIGEYLHYVINFENTGTAAAENVVVKDVFDISKYDISSLQVMSSSNSVNAKITGNKVEFIFENINLAANQHGDVVFKIKSKSDLVSGDMVTTKADIFFDYNFPIETNAANTQFQALNNNDYVIDQSVSIYPNPSKGNVLVKVNGNIKSVQLFDVQGRVLETRVKNEQEFNMDISKYSNGVYFLKVLTDKGIKIEKLIKN